MATRTYAPTDWQLTWNNILFQGFAKGTKFKVTRNTESAAMEAGCDGDVVITAKTDRTGKLEVTLQRESPTNDLLSRAHAAFEARPRVRGAGVGAFTARNIHSTSKATASKGVIEKSPDMEAADTNSSVTWTILLDDVTIFNGGALS